MFEEFPGFKYLNPLCYVDFFLSLFMLKALFVYILLQNYPLLPEFELANSH